MGNVSVDKKLQVVQMIREENRDNRLKMRSREKVLYGRELPGYSHGYGYGELHSLEDRDPAVVEQTNAAPRSTFKFRLLLAVLLFAAFLVMDKGDYTFFGLSADKIYESINDQKWQENLPAWEDLSQLTLSRQ